MLSETAHFGGPFLFVLLPSYAIHMPSFFDLRSMTFMAKPLFAQ
jgi:hypothetical protein